MTSEHEIYKNEPAARHEHNTSTTLEPDSRRHPKITPTGVNIEKTISSFKINEF